MPDWVWYTGLVVVSAGVIFIGYKLITDPYGVAEFISPNKNGRAGGSTGAGPDIKLNDTTTALGEATTGEIAENATSWIAYTPLAGLRYLGNSILGDSVSRVSNAVLNTLNPFKYVTTQVENANKFNDFMASQDRLNGEPNRKLYPYTADNPFDPWFTKIRKAFRGETPSEAQQRHEDEAAAWAAYDSFRNKGKERALEGPTLHSGYITPNPEMTGQTTPIPATSTGLNLGFYADNTVAETVSAKR